MFYSKSTGGFYSADVHGDNIPADAVEITLEEHAALLNAQSQGKRIQADADGRPVAADHVPSTETLTAFARSQRDERLAACDWTQCRDVPDTVAAAWQPYRQELRDLTKQAGFPESIIWPDTPK